MLICKSTLGITNDFGLFVVGIFDSIVLVWDIFFPCCSWSLIADPRNGAP